MTIEEILMRATHIHDQRCFCDPKYLLSCSMLQQIIMIGEWRKEEVKKANDL
jgi:hypothetical protein